MSGEFVLAAQFGQSLRRNLHQAPRCRAALPVKVPHRTEVPGFGCRWQQFQRGQFDDFLITQVSRTSDQLLLEVALARLLCLFCWLLVADVRGVCFGTAQFGQSLRRNLHQAPRCRAALPVKVPHRTEVPGFGCRWQQFQRGQFDDFLITQVSRTSDQLLLEVALARFLCLFCWLLVADVRGVCFGTAQFGQSLRRNLHQAPRCRAALPVKVPHRTEVPGFGCRWQQFQRGQFDDFLITQVSRTSYQLLLEVALARLLCLFCWLWVADVRGVCFGTAQFGQRLRRNLHQAPRCRAALPVQVPHRTEVPGFGCHWQQFQRGQFDDFLITQVSRTSDQLLLEVALARLLCLFCWLLVADVRGVCFGTAQFGQSLRRNLHQAPRCRAALPVKVPHRTEVPGFGCHWQQFQCGQFDDFLITQVSRTSDQLLLEVALARLLCLFCWLLVADVRGVCFGTAQFGQSLRRNLHQAPRCRAALPVKVPHRTEVPGFGCHWQQFQRGQFDDFLITQVSRTSDQLLLEVALARLLCLFCWLLVADVRGVCFGTAQFGQSLRRNLHQAPRCRAALPVKVPHRTEVPGFGCHWQQFQRGQFDDFLITQVSRTSDQLLLEVALARLLCLFCWLLVADVRGVCFGSSIWAEFAEELAPGTSVPCCTASEGAAPHRGARVWMPLTTVSTWSVWWLFDNTGITHKRSTAVGSCFGTASLLILLALGGRCQGSLFWHSSIWAEFAEELAPGTSVPCCTASAGAAPHRGARVWMPLTTVSTWSVWWLFDNTGITHKRSTAVGSCFGTASLLILLALGGRCQGSLFWHSSIWAEFAEELAPGTSVPCCTASEGAAPHRGARVWMPLTTVSTWSVWWLFDNTGITHKRSTAVGSCFGTASLLILLAMGGRCQGSLFWHSSIWAEFAEELAPGTSVPCCTASEGAAPHAPRCQGLDAIDNSFNVVSLMTFW